MLKDLTRLEKVGFILLAVFLIFSRLWKLDQIPATLSHDEMVYAVQAKSLIAQGTSLDQQDSWWSLHPAHVMYAEWPARVMALGFLISSNPLVATHLSSALMGISLPFIMAALTYSIWRKKSLAKATWIIFILNPLFWQLSRISYDSFYSLWFYVSAGCLLLSFKPKYIALSLPLFLIGFFQYQGFKLLLVPWISFLITLKLATRLDSGKRFKLKQLVNELKRFKLQILVWLLAIGLTLFYGLVLLPQQDSGVRLSKIIFADTDYLANIVNTERRLSLVTPLNNLFSNKPTAIWQFMLDRLLGVFDLRLLLMLVEPNVSGFSVWTHGIFYWLEIILVLVGLSAVIGNKKTRFSGLVLLVGILTLCLPALINSGGEWYLLRSMFTYLLMLVAAAWGLTVFWRQKLIVLILLLPSVFSFSYHYWFRYPIISLDWSNFDERVLARYISLTQQTEPNLKITVYGPEPEYGYWSYLLYNQLITKNNLDEIGAAMRKYPPYSKEAKYSLGQVTFSSFCAPNNPKKQSNIPSSPELIIVREHHKICAENSKKKIEKNDSSLVEATEDKKQEIDLTPPPPPPVLSISAVLDSGKRLSVYGDKICHPYTNTFIHVQNLKQLDLDKQDIPVFCENWIKNLDW
jgi:hypothetical protein